ncbi:hypothetical protein CRYUN_Cryun31cG0109900 [Craigia yunnanensis]
MSTPSGTGGMKKCRFNLKGLTFGGRGKKNASKSFKIGMKRGSEGLLTFGRSLRSGVTRAVFPEDLKVSNKMIFDPQDRSVLLWNKFFVVSCILAVSVDPLFFYLPVFNHLSHCLGIDVNLGVTTTTIRTIIDIFYLIRMGLQFRTAYIAPSSRVFGRGVFCISSNSPEITIKVKYRRRKWFFSLTASLSADCGVEISSQIKRSEVWTTKQALIIIVFIQYIPRFVRFIPLTSELKKTAGTFAEGAWSGAAYYLLWYILSGHIAEAFWYLLAVERNETCWRKACICSGKCNIDFLYCGNKHMGGFADWRSVSEKVLSSKCGAKEDHDSSPFNYGIYTQAIESRTVSSNIFFSKFCYCLWWGLQNLSTLGQGLQTSTYPGEILFSIAIAIFGLILFALLIGNMQTYLQSLTVRLEEMRIKRRDSEQWMHHRALPQDLRERVRRYDQYKWLETRGVNEENIVQSLPKDLRRDIKRHLCLNLVRRVPLFANMDERLLDAICERLKPSLYTEHTYIVREGDPVNEMLFIIRGRLESVTTDGGRSGFFNRGLLKEGDFCGEELLTWALDPKAGSNLPSSTRTVKALNEVDAFALEAEELKFVSSQYRRLHSRQSDNTAESYSIGATIFASRFAANLRGHKNRGTTSSKSLIKVPKPPEPDFNDLDTDELGDKID